MDDDIKAFKEELIKRIEIQDIMNDIEFYDDKEPMEPEDTVIDTIKDTAKDTTMDTAKDIVKDTIKDPEETNETKEKILIKYLEEKIDKKNEEMIFKVNTLTKIVKEKDEEIKKMKEKMNDEMNRMECFAEEKAFSITCYLKLLSFDYDDYDNENIVLRDLHCWINDNLDIHFDHNSPYAWDLKNYLARKTEMDDFDSLFYSRFYLNNYIRQMKEINTMTLADAEYLAQKEPLYNLYRKLFEIVYENETITLDPIDLQDYLDESMIELDYNKGDFEKQIPKIIDIKKLDEFFKITFIEDLKDILEEIFYKFMETFKKNEDATEDTNDIYNEFREKLKKIHDKYIYKSEHEDDRIDERDLEPFIKFDNFTYDYREYPTNISFIQKFIDIEGIKYRFRYSLCNDLARLIFKKSTKYKKNY